MKTSMCKMKVLTVFIAMSAMLFLIVGCGKSVLKTDLVRGTITLNGRPLAEASVAFSPATPGAGNPAYARTDANGVYELQTNLGAPGAGTTPGEYIVTVSKAIMVPTGKTSIQPDGTKSEEKEPKNLLPEKYGDKNKSEFRATVVSGKENVFNFDLEGPEN